MKHSFFLFLICVPVLSCTSTITADRDAHTSTESVFRYLRSLPEKKKKKLLSGQDLGHGNKILKGRETGYDRLVKPLHPYVPAIIGADYGFMKDKDFHVWNKELIEHWKQGSLIELSWHFQSPWTGENSNSIEDANLEELIKGESEASLKWFQQLKEVGDVLEELQRHNVVVLWRPFHELNGDWFWWGNLPHAGSPEPLIALWRHMFHYLHDERDIHNIIWVYSVTGYRPSDSWGSPIGHFYPGEDYVDIVGIDIYSDTAECYGEDDYQNLKQFGKPIAITEFGPFNQNDGTWSYSTLIRSIKTRYPDFIYWLSWHDWEKDGEWVNKSIASNSDSLEALMDPWVVNQADLPQF